MNGKNTKRAGLYYIENSYYPSVTQIIGILAKPALTYWFGKQVYQVMALNPELTEQQALAAPYQVSETAKGRGTAVHDIVEAWEHTSRVVGQEGPYAGYAQAFQLWVDHNQVKLVEHERTVVSKEFRFAGTLDLLVMIDGFKKPTLIDIKTGKDLYPEVHLQLSAYKQALKEDGVEVEGTAALLLMEDGTYKFEVGKDKFKEFLACKTIWDGLNEELMSKANEAQQKELI
jgi:hypothetical protein